MNNKDFNIKTLLSIIIKAYGVDEFAQYMANNMICQYCLYDCKNRSKCFDNWKNTCEQITYS